MDREHPLSDIFSVADLERLAQGTCLTSNGRADRHVAWRLTASGYESDPWLLALREWFRQAASHDSFDEEHYRQRFRSGVGSLKAFCQPAGELMVAYFLEKQLERRLTLAYIAVAASRRTPEFEVTDGLISMIVEVKTIGDYPWGAGGDFLGAAPSRAPSIRDDIRHAVRQMDKAKCNLLVVVDQGQPPIWADYVVDAMHGTEYLSIPYDASGTPGQPHFRRDRNGKLGPKSNTRVGAIGILTWNGNEKSRGYFVHNIHAAKPIPPTLLDPWPQLVDGREWRNAPCLQ